MLTEEMKRLVDRVRLGFVATVTPEGAPNVSPKGTLSVLDDQHLVFADLCSPGTVANLGRTPHVEVNVVDPFARRGFRFRGTAVVHQSGAEFARLVRFFAERKLRDAPRRIRSVVVISVTSARPLVSPVYETGATEAEVRAHWRQYYLGDETAN